MPSEVARAHAVGMGDACPHCAAEVVYVGLRRIECNTPGCPNGPAEDRAPARRETHADEELLSLLYETCGESFAFF